MADIEALKAQARAFAAGMLEAAEVEEIVSEELVDFENAQFEEQDASLLQLYETAANPLIGNYASKEKSIRDHLIQRPVHLEEVEQKYKVIPERDAKDAASKFEKRNPEMHANSLLNLLKKAQDCKTKEELLKLLESYYADPLLADEALDFLSEATLGDLKEMVLEAKSDFNKQYEKDIQAEKNIAQEVSRFAGKDVEAKPKLRQRYLELIHTSEEKGASDLFLDYSKQFPSYKEMRKIFAYFYRALGMDLKSQGPSIEKGFLHALLQEVRKAQSGIGLYNFFRDRMDLIQKEFDRNGLTLPPGMTFEKMTVAFLKLISERYPSLEKVLENLPFSTVLDLLGKIIVANQFRDALPQTSSAFLFRSEQHKDELKKSILDALENLEERLEELEDKEWTEEDTFDDDEKPKKKKKQQDDQESEDST